ncbi:MUC6 protein, partial [Polypterus senegalus]
MEDKGRHNEQSDNPTEDNLLNEQKASDIESSIIDNKPNVIASWFHKLKKVHSVLKTATGEVDELTQQIEMLVNNSLPFQNKANPPHSYRSRHFGEVLRHGALGVAGPHHGVRLEPPPVIRDVAKNVNLHLSGQRGGAVHKVKVSKNFHGRLCGLCGDFNGDPLENELLIDGIINNPFDFINLQKLDDPNEFCELLDPDGIVNYECGKNVSLCAHLLDLVAPDCVIEKQDYILRCQEDLCFNKLNPNPIGSCETLSEYSRACSLQKQPVANWRTTSFCSIGKCPGNQIYKECGMPCIPSCSNPQYVCTETCQIGCFCPPGLCGNYNDNSVDDFENNMGIRGGTGAQFANFWRLSKKCKPAKDKEIDPCNLSFLNAAYSEFHCGILLNKSSIFASCHSLVSPHQFYRRCRYEACNYEETSRFLCGALESYARACAEKGLILEKWREECMENCTITCPRQHEFSYNVRTCKHTCYSLQYPEICYQSMVPLEGCQCPNGTYLDNNGGCVIEEKCPCFLENGTAVALSQTVLINETSCTCQKGVFNCEPYKACPATCIHYGEGHFITFDNTFFNFDGACEYTMLTNITVELSNSTIKVTPQSAYGLLTLKTNYLYLMLSMGIPDTDNIISIIWNYNIQIIINVIQNTVMKLCGLCGNYNQLSSDDFIERNGASTTNVYDFGNSWREDPECLLAETPPDPCQKNSFRFAWAQKKCSILRSSVFAKCHSLLYYGNYYEACVHDACGCDMGGDCECVCNSIAVYAKECLDLGVCIDWRTPDFCPVYCDYFNTHVMVNKTFVYTEPESCAWHYQPCLCSSNSYQSVFNIEGECHDLVFRVMVQTNRDKGIDLPGPHALASPPAESESWSETVSEVGKEDLLISGELLELSLALSYLLSITANTPMSQQHQSHQLQLDSQLCL